MVKKVELMKDRPHVSVSSVWILSFWHTHAALAIRELDASAALLASLWILLWLPWGLLYSSRQASVCFSLSSLIVPHQHIGWQAAAHAPPVPQHQGRHAGNQLSSWNHKLERESQIWQLEHELCPYVSIAALVLLHERKNPTNVFYSFQHYNLRELCGISPIQQLFVCTLR